MLQFAIAYREFELLEYIMTKFGIFPPTPPEELTVDNVCIVYEKNTDEVNYFILKPLSLKYFRKQEICAFSLSSET